MKNTCIYPGTQTPGIDSQHYSQHFPQDYSQGYSQNYSQDYVQTHWTSDSVQPWQKKLFWQLFIKKMWINTDNDNIDDNNCLLYFPYVVQNILT